MHYPWPASALTPDDMAVLHRVRQHGYPRTPINRLIAKAVRETYSRSPSGVPHGINKLTPLTPGAPHGPDNHMETPS